MSVIDELPTAVASALEVSEDTAGFILAASIIVSVALVLAILKMNTVGILVVIVPLLVLTVAFGWVPYWVLILVILIVAALFGKKMSEWFSGTPGTE